MLHNKDDTDKMKYQSEDKTLTIHVPYDVPTWNRDTISVNIRIESLLQMILPTECLGELNCCATKKALGIQPISKREVEVTPDISEYDINDDVPLGERW